MWVRRDDNTTQYLYVEFLDHEIGHRRINWVNNVQYTLFEEEPLSETGMWEMGTEKTPEGFPSGAT